MRQNEGFETDKERQVERDLGKTDFGRSQKWLLLYLFLYSCAAGNLSVCNENHYELTFLSRVLSTLTAPLWINILIVFYIMLILISMVVLLLNLITCYYLDNYVMLMLGV